MSSVGLLPRLSIVTLGVASVPKARAFYEALGWVASSASQAEVAFFQLSGVVLALFGRDALADDATVAPAGEGFRSFTLAHNVGSEAEVDEAIAHAVNCGGRLVKPAHKVHWGGYSGYFSDPDGHLWEVAYNPFFPFDEAGRLVLPGPNPGSAS